MHNSIVLGKTPDSLSNCLMLQIVYYSKAQRKDVQPDTVCLISRGIFTYKKKCSYYGGDWLAGRVISVYF